MTKDFEQTFDVVMDRGCLAVLLKREDERFFEKVHSLLNPKGYIFLKIDKTTIMKRPEKMKNYNLFFSEISEWEGKYVRSDEKEIKTMFFIDQKKE